MPREDFSQLVDPKNYGSFMDTLYNVVVDGKTDGLEKVVKTVQNFLQFPAVRKDAEIQAFTSKGDMPELFTRLPYINIQTDNFDFGYEAAFRNATLDTINGVQKLTWEIVTGSDNIVFEEMAEGQGPVVASATADKVLARCTRKSGALGWTDELIRDRALNILIERAMLFRNAYYVDKANRHYTVLRQASEAVGNTPISWQTTTETVGVTLDRDRRTLNLAAFTLANRLKDKGYGDMSNPQMLLYVNPTLKSRIQQALATNLTGVIVPTQVTWNITPVYTFNANLPANTSYGLLVVPGNKLQKADAMLPTSFMKADVATMTYVEYVHSYYGAVGADTDQVLETRFA